MLPYLASSTPLITPLSRKALVGTVDEQFKLEHDLEIALQAHKAGKSAQAISLLESAQQSVLRLREHQRNCLAPAYFNQCVKPGGTTVSVQSVFAITELLEQILLDLSTADLLHAQQANKGMRDTIEGSMALKQQLFLLPDPEAHLEVLPTADLHTSLNAPNIFMKRIRQSACILTPEYQPNRRLHNLQVSFSLPLPKLGSRIRQMLITQPPIQQMAMTINCCEMKEREEYGLQPLLAKRIVDLAGLTLGELYDEAKQAITDHENCAFASPYIHNADGSVDLKVKFRTQIVLDHDHPEVVADVALQQRKGDDRDRVKTEQKLMLDFARQRHTVGQFMSDVSFMLLRRLTLSVAFTQGNPDLTFEQFRSTKVRTKASSFETMSLAETD
ncbi:hypothetical protein LTR17_015542 [Elasticomyces elasticus]|nr:hypothetical protein LTR17_015542 [Elasticomyces elasticus]